MLSSSGAQVSVRVADLDTGAEALTGDDHLTLPVAGLGVVPLLIEVAAQIEFGQLDPLEIIERRSVDEVALAGLWQHLAAPALPVRDLAVLAAADAARWATTHTPREAAFLVDPAADGYFRPLSRRPVFITSLDCAGILWSIGYAGEYTRRMADLGHDPRRVFGRPPVGLLRRLGDEGLLRLAAKYGLSYAVLDLAQPTRLPVVYRNSRLQIVALSLPLPATTPPATAPRAP